MFAIDLLVMKSFFMLFKMFYKRFEEYKIQLDSLTIGYPKHIFLEKEQRGAIGS